MFIKFRTHQVPGGMIATCYSIASKAPLSARRQTKGTADYPLQRVDSIDGIELTGAKASSSDGRRRAGRKKSEEVASRQA
jgi:hypothetical protein